MTKSIGKVCGVGLWGAVIGLSGACGGAAPAPGSAQAETEASASEGEGGDPASEAPEGASQGETGEGAAPLSVGQITDGAVLDKLEISWVGGGSLVRFVFDGQGAPPVTQASLTPDGMRVVVEIHGVREVRAGIPLVTGEGGTVLGKPKAIAEGPIADVGRYFLGDDSGVRLELGLREPVRLELKEGSAGRSVDLIAKSKD